MVKLKDNSFILEAKKQLIYIRAKLNNNNWK